MKSRPSGLGRAHSREGASSPGEPPRRALGPARDDCRGSRNGRCASFLCEARYAAGTVAIGPEHSSFWTIPGVLMLCPPPPPPPPAPRRLRLVPPPPPPPPQQARGRAATAHDGLTPPPPPPPPPNRPTREGRHGEDAAGRRKLITGPAQRHQFVDAGVVPAPSPAGPDISGRLVCTATVAKFVGLSIRQISNLRARTPEGVTCPFVDVGTGSRSKFRWDPDLVFLWLRESARWRASTGATLDGRSSGGTRTGHAAPSSALTTPQRSRSGARRRGRSPQQEPTNLIEFVKSRLSED